MMRISLAFFRILQALLTLKRLEALVDYYLCIAKANVGLNGDSTVMENVYVVGLACIRIYGLTALVSVYVCIVNCLIIVYNTLTVCTEIAVVNAGCVRGVLVIRAEGNARDLT